MPLSDFARSHLETGVRHPDAAKEIADAIDSGGGGGGLLTATVPLTNDEIIALPTTFKELVATPGSGKIIVPLYCILSSTISVAYTNIDATASYITAAYGNDAQEPLTAVLNDGFSTPLSSLLTTSSFTVLSTPSFANNGDFFTNKSYLMPSADGNGIALNLVCANSGNFTGGDAANGMKVTAYYVIVDI